MYRPNRIPRHHNLLSQLTGRDGFVSATSVQAQRRRSRPVCQSRLTPDVIATIRSFTLASIRLRLKVKSKLVDLASELERRIIAVLQQGHSGARILADIETLVFRESEGRGVLHRIPGHLLAIDGQHAGTALAQTRLGRFEIEHDRVFAGFELRSLPHRPLEVEQVVEK